MRKSLKKIALGCAATMALSVVMSASAFAADITSAVTFDKDAGTVTVDTTNADVAALTEGQYTILIFESTADETNLTADDIMYINQDAKSGIATTFAGMGMKNGLQDNKTYVLKMGGENVAASGILRAEFTIENGKVIMLGDPTGNGIINSEDAIAILKHSAEIELLTGDAFTAADVVKNNIVNSEDAIAVLKHAAEIEFIVQPQ